MVLIKVRNDPELVSTSTLTGSTDLGTSPFELLPTSTFTCPNVKRMGVVTGKSGKTYILNLDNLGGYQNGPNKLDAIPTSFQNENSVYSGAAVYPLEGGYIYINVIQVRDFFHTGESFCHFVCIGPPFG